MPSNVGATDEVNYFYDAQSLLSLVPAAPGFSRGASIGRMVAATYGPVSTAPSSAGDYLSYDSLGRVVLKIQQTGGVNYQASAAYNKASQPTSLAYPSYRTVNSDVDSAGRTTSVIGNLGDNTTRNYATGIIYDAAGRLKKEKFGTDTPIYNKLFYNVRGQLAEIRESTSYTGPTDTTWDRGAIINHYSAQCWGMCGGSSSTTPMTDNNGNLKKQDNYIPGATQVTFTDAFNYDALNRLQDATESKSVNGGAATQSFVQAYAYDRFGNRRINQSGTTQGVGINSTQAAVVTNTTTNRLYAAGETETNHPLIDYDPAGNQKKDYYSGNGVSYDRIYDAENRMVTSTATDSFGSQISAYTYDGNGARVKRKVSGTETWQVYGLGGELLAEYAINGNATAPQKVYGYRNGELLITADAPTTQTGQTQNVEWTNAVGVSVSSISLTKTATTVWGNAGAASTQTLTSGDGYVEMTVGETGHARIFGFSHTDTNQNWDTIDFGLHCSNHTDNAIYIYESGTERGTFGAYAVGDKLRVSIVGGVVKYSKNGNVLYTSTLTPTYPLRVDTALYETGTTLMSGMVSGNLSGGGPSSNIQWLVTDQLVTPRMVFDKTGSLANMKRHDYLPFGEELAGQSGRSQTQGYSLADNIRQKFTLKERDNETGLDYFGARYYSSTLGRFTSPDDPFVDQTDSDPQSWNLYQYGANNPLRFIDPDGLAHWDKTGNYVGDYNGEYDADLEAVWHKTKKGGYWDFEAGRYIAIRCSLSESELYIAKLEQRYFDEWLQARRERQEHNERIANLHVMGGTLVLFGPITNLNRLLNAAEEVSLLGTARMNLLNVAKNSKLRNLINDLYKATAKIGSGSTADVIRFERQTGILMSKTGHMIKGKEYLGSLEGLVRSGKLSAGDQAIAREIINDLKDAMK